MKIALSNIDEIRVTADGSSVAVDIQDFPAWLADRQTEQTRIHARNHRSVDGGATESEWSIEFRIASKQELSQCDKAFLAILAVPHPTTANAEEFLQDAPVSRGARDYSGALADYVIGLLLKEQVNGSGIRGEMRMFRGKLSSVLETLNGYETPVAQSVSAVSGFCLNSWKTLNVPSEMSELADAVRFFRSLSTLRITENLIKQQVAGDPVCYVDHATRQIIDATIAYLQGAINDSTLDPAVWEKRRSSLTEYDLVKAEVLLAAVEQRRGNRDSARNHLKRLQFDGFFGQWARQQLDRS
jgi:hypothetical protein